MERYLGADVHATSCTFSVLDASGKQIRRDVVETNGQALVGYLKQIAGNLHLCIEEGQWSQWLVEILSPRVAEMVVFRGEWKPGSKSDAMVTGDVVRTKNRLKNFYRSRGVACTGESVYSAVGREKRAGQLPVATRQAVELIGRELDQLLDFKAEAEAAMLRESHRHRISRILETAPGLGPIRVAQMLPIVITPHRFRTKRQFWAYCGFGVVVRSSADWIREDGRWVKARVNQTRGLNFNHNRALKAIFKGAATTVITRKSVDPLRGDYDRLLESGTKPNLAKLTIARKVAAIALTMWKREERYSPEKYRLADVT